LRSLSGSTNRVESFSADGPRKLFFHTNGVPITPDNTLFGTLGGVNLQKPDVTAADGVAASTPGYAPFFGTSAAAAHLAGIAALVKSANTNLTSFQIRQILTTNVWDIMAPGYDRDSGQGIINAAAAVQAALGIP
jgi:subtilisin family serine protease